MADETTVMDMGGALDDLGQALLAEITAIVGAGNVDVSDRARDVSRHDVRWTGEVRSLFVVHPRDTRQLCAAIAATTRAGFAVVARGGGLSYTKGYLPHAPRSVTFELGGMNRVLRIDPENMFVTVEAGCTWLQLREALAPHGLRPPMWGTGSGFRASIGGGLSQNSVLFGSSSGLTADSTLSVGVVLADGSLLETGSAAFEGTPPFFRYNGPDLTGLFLGDCGAMGIKATVTLRLVREPALLGHVSLAFFEHEPLFDTMRDLAREGLVSECFAFDPGLNGQQEGALDFGKDVRTVAQVARSGWTGPFAALRIAIAGRRIFRTRGWTMHAGVEAESRAELKRKLRRIRAIGAGRGGKAIAPSVPRIMRTTPFPPPDSMLGTRGERWAPIHGVLPPANAARAMTEIAAMRAEMKAELDAHGITTGTLTLTIATNGFIVEPVCWYPVASNAWHEHVLGKEHMAGLTPYPPADEIVAVVDRMHERTIAILRANGAIFMQIGKYYPYAQSLSPVASKLVHQIKQVLDPDLRMNPGNLGLGL